MLFYASAPVRDCGAFTANVAACRETTERCCEQEHREGGGGSLLLIVHDGGSISSHGLLFDHTDELKGAAEGSIRIGPFRTLEMSDLQDVVVLSHGKIR